MASKRQVSVDMSGIESFNKAPEGKHSVKITKADFTQSQGGNDVIRVRFEVTKGKAKGTSVVESYSLSENALWKLKGLLQALGMKADGRLKLDLDKLEGKTLDVLVVHEEYNGVWRAKISEAYKLGTTSDDIDDEDDDDDDDDELEDIDDDEDDDDEPVKKPAAKKAAVKKPETKKKSVIEDDEDDDDWEDE